MLRITGGGKGFHMTFENGWTASIQWGAGNYSDNHHANFDLEKHNWESSTAEVARWFKEGRLVRIGSDNVKGWLSAAEVLAFLNQTAALGDIEETECGCCGRLFSPEGMCWFCDDWDKREESNHFCS